MRFPFPKDFMFGAASSAFQIESAAAEGGKGLTCPDVAFANKLVEYNNAHFNDKVKKYSTSHMGPNDCADFYHHYREDIADMKKLGLKAFRFSISWARIYPNGPDEICQNGIDYYNDMINALVEADIIPFFDLYHCDLPYWVMERGGLINREFIGWYTKYAKTCFEAYGDRVKYWSTVNEPEHNIMAAHLYGLGIPYIKDVKTAITACHHMILAHYEAVRLYKSMGFDGKIGLVNNSIPHYTYNLNEKDLKASEHFADFAINWWLQPAFKGTYPHIAYFDRNMPESYRNELEEKFIQADFIGVNTYGAAKVKYDAEEPMEFKHIANDVVKEKDGFSNIYPQSIMDIAIYLSETYPGIPLIITENGTSKRRGENFEEDRHDPYRINYLRESLREISRCIRLGIDIRGYFYWSLMDTYEGATAHMDHLFGLVQIDFETKERFFRDSWYYYKEVIEHCEVN